jgi:hypothetical protein
MAHADAKSLDNFASTMIKELAHFLGALVGVWHADRAFVEPISTNEAIANKPESPFCVSVPEQ